MAKFSIELVPSKSLLLSHQVLEILSKTFARHEIHILKKSTNETMQLKFCFKIQEGKLVQEMGKLKLQADRVKTSNRPGADMTLRVIKNVMKCAKAEADVASRSFLLTIEKNQVSIETRGRVTKIRLHFIQNYFTTIISHVCEAYGEIGWNVFLKEKYGNVFEKPSNRQNGDED